MGHRSIPSSNHLHHGTSKIPLSHRQYSAWQLLELLAVSSFIEQGCQSPDLIDMPRVHLAEEFLLVVSPALPVLERVTFQLPPI
ncbi:hypothetical protein Tco_1257563 [Tanacetum coccineum]